MKVRHVLLYAAVGAAPFVAMPYAAAQTSPPPTVPCPGCGPSGGKLPTGNARAWVYTEHRCQIMNGVNRSNFNLVIGLNAAYPNPATFTATVDDVATATPLVTVPLGIVNPGTQRTTGTIVTVAPRQTITMKVTARDTVTGAAVRFGDSTFVKTSQLTCDCPQPPPPPTTVQPPASTVPVSPTTPPSPSVTTTPGVPPATSPSAPSTPGVTTPFELPATGWDAGDVTALGVMLGFLGFVCWLIANSRSRRES